MKRAVAEATADIIRLAVAQSRKFVHVWLVPHYAFSVESLRLLVEEGVIRPDGEFYFALTPAGVAARAALEGGVSS